MAVVYGLAFVVVAVAVAALIGTVLARLHDDDDPRRDP